MRPADIYLSVAYLQAIQELDSIGDTALIGKLAECEAAARHQVLVVLDQMKRLQSAVVQEEVLDLLLGQLLGEAADKDLKGPLLYLG